MCRLFGLRAGEPQAVDRALRTGSNALAKQSLKHPDGWGLAFFGAGEAGLERNTAPAHASGEFARLSQAVKAPVVLAHIRKASVGGNTLANTHPFTHDGWVFAHNGTVRGFPQARSAFEKAIAPTLRPHLKGETDSERCFYLFLTYLQSGKGDRLERAARALARTAKFALAQHPREAEKPTSVTFLATDGDALLALRVNRELSFSTHRRPGERPARTGQAIRHLLVASEPTHPGEAWRRVGEGCGVGTDSRLKLFRFRLS